MTDYDLSRLSSRSFEHLVQSIASKIIGPDIVIFGDGPDGAREATFDGPISYPNQKRAWNGYGIIQAKFKQRLENTKKDGEWVLNQLEAELKKFTDPKNNFKRPEYYILVTNVRLTAVHGKGSKDRVSETIQKYVPLLGLKGYDIWDYDKLRVYLDGLPEITRTYAAWISPGDVLSEVMQWIKPKTLNFEQCLTNFLQKELLADLYVNLDQAGHSTEEKIPLANVFVDLPAYRAEQNEPPTEWEQTRRNGFVSDLLAIAQEHVPVEGLQEPNQDLFGQEGLPTGRIVLIGGPGQGKTTIGQFVCQLFRAAILSRRPSSELSAELKQGLNEFENQCQTEEIDFPKVPRFPIRISLSDLAAKLSNREHIDINGEHFHVNSVLSYISYMFSRRTNYTVSPGDLREWLGIYPWFIFLDGLDEVPPSSNRGEVLEAIRDFWVDASMVGADLLVLATTRPQGYQEEFSPQFYRHLWLGPLSKPRALHYGMRLALNRFGNDPERQERVVTRLNRAIEQEATARLMRSPLQITIMTTLVDRMGQPPQERWNLFKEYYNIIYQREIERDIPASSVLRDYKPHIDAVHQSVAILLQVENEFSGKSDVRLSVDRFNTIVKDTLREEGYTGEILDSLTDSITKAAAERLVFLVGLESDRVGFEIRSLQEFMVSEALLNGNETIVQQRLEHIAPIASWENTILFAAGKIFSERPYLRDTILAICAKLNEDSNGVPAREILLGSQLALNILADGSARRHPKYAQALARIAFNLLEIPDDFHSRFLEVYDPTLEQVYRDELEARLSNEAPSKYARTWLLLLTLIDGKIAWVEGLLERHFPQSAMEQGVLIDMILKHNICKFLIPRLFSGIPTISILVHRNRGMLASALHNIKKPPWLKGIKHWLEVTNDDSNKEELTFTIDKQYKVGLRFTALYRQSSSITALKNLPDGSDDWNIVRSASRFIAEPSKDSLSYALRDLAQNITLLGSPMVSNLPWPMSALIRSVQDARQLNNLAEEVERGQFGDLEDWYAAEGRWRNQGVSGSDFEYVRLEHWPFDSNIARIGFPFASVKPPQISLGREIVRENRMRLYRVSRPSGAFRRFSQLAAGNPASMGRVWVLGHVQQEFQFYSISPTRVSRMPFSLDPTILLEAQIAHNHLLILNYLATALATASGRTSMVSMIDQIGREASEIIDIVQEWGGSSKIFNLPVFLEQEFRKTPSRIGLLRLLGHTSGNANRLANEPELTDPKRYVDPNVQLAVIAIRLAQPNLSEEDLRMLEELTADLLGLDEVNLAPLTSIISEDSPNIGPFLHKLRTTHPLSYAKVCEDAYQFYMGIIRQRRSSLREPLSWTQLQLPQVLTNMLPRDN